LETCNSAGILGGLTLRVVEVWRQFSGMTQQGQSTTYMRGQ
jgi:hypothetical protein